MGIKARGGKNAYLYVLLAIKNDGNSTRQSHATAFDTADSDDEAYGRAMKIAHLIYPQSRGWSGHFASHRQITGIGWVGRHDMSKIEPVD